MSARPIESPEDRRAREDSQRQHRNYLDAEKQYVRLEAWVPAARERLEKITRRIDKRRKNPDERFLTYFSLCAEEAIDVRLLGDLNLVQLDERGYPGVAFCERESDQYVAAITKLGRTRAAYLADFVDLVKDEDPQSAGFRAALPFDVYNLDFTQPCFPPFEDSFSNFLNAIVTLIENHGKACEQQPANVARGFELFLTFRANPDEENPTALAELKNNLDQNLAHYSWFKEALLSRYERIDQLVNSYHMFLLLMLPKFIGRIGSDVGFKVKCTYRLYYPRRTPQNRRYFMISFGLSFDWTGTARVNRQSLAQPPSREEVRVVAYLDMLRSILSQDPENVGEKIRSQRPTYERSVKELLERTHRSDQAAH